VLKKIQAEILTRPEQKKRLHNVCTGKTGDRKNMKLLHRVRKHAWGREAEGRGNIKHHLELLAHEKNRGFGSRRNNMSWHEHREQKPKKE